MKKTTKKTKLKKLLTKNKLTSFKKPIEYLKVVAFIILIFLSIQSFLLYKENTKFKENLNTLTTENQLLYEFVGKSETDKIEDGKKQEDLNNKLNTLEKELETLKNKPPEIIEKRVEVPVETTVDKGDYCKKLGDSFRLANTDGSYDKNRVEGMAQAIELKCQYGDKPDMVIKVN